MTLERKFTLDKSYYATGSPQVQMCETKHQIRIGQMVGKSGVPHTILIGFDPFQKGGAGQGFLAGFTLGLSTLFTDTPLLDWGRVNQSSHKIKVNIKRTAPDGSVEWIAQNDVIAGPRGNNGWTYQDYPMGEDGTYDISVINLATGECQGGSRQFYEANQRYHLSREDINNRTKYDFGGSIPKQDELGEKEQTIALILGAIALVVIPVALIISFSGK